MEPTAVKSEAKGIIIESITKLLENKHLYQNVSIDFSDIDKRISEINSSKTGSVVSALAPGKFISNLQEVIDDIITNYWFFDTYTFPLRSVIDLAPHADDNVITLTLPTINIICKNCKGRRLPHNSGYARQKVHLLYVAMVDPTKDDSVLDKIIQTFFFPYQCQKCKGEPIIFMVRRTGLKLQLVGRNHPGLIDIPKYLPKRESKYYREAIIAYTAGKVLAGLFYLRTFIEQYMRRVTGKGDDKITGEDLGEAYAKLLDAEFPKSFKTLKKIYEELSIPLHSANDNAKQFEQSKLDVLKHFEALRLIPLKEGPGQLDQ